MSECILVDFQLISNFMDGDYVMIQVKIDASRTGSASYDRWSLISLSNIVGRSVEIKFVVSMRRQYEFSIDSFQVSYDDQRHSSNWCPLPVNSWLLEKQKF